MMLGQAVRKTQLPLVDKQKALDRLNGISGNDGGTAPQARML